MRCNAASWNPAVCSFIRDRSSLERSKTVTIVSSEWSALLDSASRARRISSADDSYSAVCNEFTDAWTDVIRANSACNAPTSSSHSSMIFGGRHSRNRKAGEAADMAAEVVVRTLVRRVCASLLSSWLPIGWSICDFLSSSDSRRGDFSVELCSSILSVAPDLPALFGIV